MKKWYRAAALVVAAVLAVSLAACGQKQEETKRPAVAYDQLELPDEGVTGTVAENGTYRLSWDPDRACAILTDLQTGAVWSTVPYSFYQTGKTAGKAGVTLSSPMMIRYVARDNKNAVKTVNAYTGVLKNGELRTQKIENGVRVYYCFDKLELVVPVEYCLRENGFAISVVPADIVEYDRLVVSVSPAPFLCSAENAAGEDRYLVTPSGSGALMYTDARGAGAAREYHEEVYGADPACYQGEQTLNTAAVRLAMFGVKNGENALCGMIESGAPAASITATAGDAELGYSAVYPTFTVRGSNISAIAFQGGNVNEVETVSETLCRYDRLTVGYCPLTGAKADYIGMAEAYRRFLSDACGEKEATGQERGLTVELLGGLQIKQLMLGVPYRKTEAATTFDEALSIIQEIRQDTGLPISAVLSGFGASGLDVGKPAGGFGFGGMFGGAKQFDRLNRYCRENGIPLFADFDLINFSRSGSGFSSTFDAAKASNMFTAYRYFYSVALRQKDEDDTRYVMISRKKLPQMGETLLRFALKKGLPGVGLSTLGNTAYSDYDAADTAVRCGMDTDGHRMVQSFRKQGVSVVLRDANDYAAVAADQIIEAPTSSSLYDVLDRDIPLYQAVMQGFCRLSAGSVNTAANPRKRFLQAIESGCGLAFTLSARVESEFATTKHSAFAASLFSDNAETIRSLAEESRAYYRAIAGAGIASHEILSDTVRRTRFDNGAEVLVNYGGQDALIDGNTVKAGGFLLKEGGETA